MIKVKYLINKVFIILGVVLWIGALSPEIFIKSGDGCIFDENGEALTEEEAEEFMESYFYDDMDNKKVKIKYKIALFDF